MTDVNVTLGWRHDDALMHMVVSPRRTITLEIEQRWIEQAIRDHVEGRHLRFGMVLPNGRLIGAVHLTNIDRDNRTCNTGILIGDRTEHGKGRAKEAYSLALPIAFDHLGMNSIRANILEYNVASKRLYESLGFQLEGVKRQGIFKDGEYHDLLMYSLLRDDYLV